MKAGFCLLLVSVASFAQSPTDLFEKAPPGVEDALRTRVAAFYQTWIEGKFRAGEKFVAESAQEAYYQMPKQRYESCEVIRLKWERDFKDVMVTLACQGKWNIQGQMLDTKMAHTDFWTLEKDDWVLSEKPVTSAPSPFGDLYYGNVKDSGALFDPKTGLPKDQKAIETLGQGILKTISVDKDAVRLSSFEKASAVVIVKNGLTGEVQVHADPDNAPPGFTVSLDKTTIPANGEAKVTFAMDPKDKSPKANMLVNIVIEPFNRRFPVAVTFAIPPEIEKLIEKSKTGK